MEVKKITCLFIPIENNFIFNIKELIKIFGDKMYYTTMVAKYSIISSEPIIVRHEDIFFSAISEFEWVGKDYKHDFDHDNATFEVITKEGGIGSNCCGKFKLCIAGDEYEVSVPNRSQLFEE